MGRSKKQLGRRFPIRRLGWAEVVHSAVFAILLALAFRMQNAKLSRRSAVCVALKQSHV